MFHRAPENWISGVTWDCWNLELWGSPGSMASQGDGTAHSYALCPLSMALCSGHNRGLPMVGTP